MNPTTRIILFLFLCIPIRLSFVYAAKELNDKYIKYFMAMIGLIGINTLYLWISNKRLDAPEGGGITWWAPFRLLHAFLYLTAFFYLLRGNRQNASISLLIDVMLGLSIFFFVK